MMTYLAPLEKSEWTLATAAHLGWRIGFGEGLDRHESLFQKGVQGAVDEYLSQTQGKSEFGAWGGSGWESREEFIRKIDSLSKEKKESKDPSEQKALEKEIVDLQNQSNQLNQSKLEELSLDWIGRINQTTRPFSQKLLLFWHNHFAISCEKVDSRLFALYLDLLLSKGLSTWGELLLQIARSPAMLVHLDNRSNVKGHPNENFARELMELFTLGIGNYTEVDVRESARAFTGWTFDHSKAEFLFQSEQHDEKNKIFFGKEGTWNGDQIIEMILDHPESSRFLANKIWSYFAYENPEPALIDEFASAIRDLKFDLRAIFRLMFQSKAFYSLKARGTQVKSPVQLVAGTLRLLGQERLPAELIEKTMRLMGMDLLRPPEVNGWPSGFRWVNTSTLLLRYNFMNLVIHGKMPGQLQEGKIHPSGESISTFDPVPLLSGRSISTASDVVDSLLDLLIQRPLQSDLRDRLVRYIETDQLGGSSTFDMKNRMAPEKVRGLIHLILSSPDYQLC